MDLMELEAVLGLDTSPYVAAIKGATDIFGNLASLVGKGLTTTISVVWDFAKDAYETGLGFDAQMSAVQAVLGKTEGTEENMIKLRQFALDQAKDSIFTAEETGEAYYYMGMAGWKTEQMLAGLPGILDLAAASGEDLGKVSDIVTDSITAFGLTADDVQGYVDLLAQTVTNSNTNVKQLGDAFKYAAPLAGALGLDVDDMALSFGLMASQYIKGSQAGTSMRQILQRLSTDTGMARTNIEKLGVKIFDSKGKMRDWGDIIDDSRKAFKGLTEEEKINYAYSIAGQRGMSGWLAIMNATDKDVNKLKKSLQDTKGAAKDMADVKLDSLDGDIKRLQSSWDILKIAFYDDTKGPMREIVQEAKVWIDDITEAIGANGLQGGIDMLATHIEHLADDEHMKELLKAVGSMVGVIFDGIFSKILPKVIEVAPTVFKSILGAITDSVGAISIGDWFANIVENLSNDEGVKRGLHTIGVMLGNEFDSLIEILLPKVTLAAPKLIAAFVSGLGGGVAENSGIVRSVMGLVDSADSIWWQLVSILGFGNTDKPDEKSITIPFDPDIQPVTTTVTETKTAIESDPWSIPLDPNVQVIEKMGDDIAQSGTDGAATAAVNAEAIMSQSSGDIANDLETKIGDAGTPAGTQLGDNIQAMLSARDFVVDIVANVIGLPGGVSIKQHASAMNPGYIFRKPTIFGYSDGAYQVAGDAGPEAVVGTSSLQRMIQGAVYSAMPVTVPRNTDRPINIVFELDGAQKWVYRLNKAEEQRVGLKLNGGVI